jgi:hypothetical protein
MKTYVLAALLATTAIPAWATQQTPATQQTQVAQQSQGQAQNQKATSTSKATSQSSAGAAAGSSSISKGGSAVASGGSGGTASTGASSSTAGSGGNSLQNDNGDSSTEVYAISYTDAAPPTVPASIGSGVVVTTWGVKVLGPVFGMTDQHVHYLPEGLMGAAAVAEKATTNDGTYAGEQRQFAYIAAVCAHDAPLAEQLNIACK